MRTAERDAHVNAIRADHDARAANDRQTAGRHRQLAAIWRALEAKAAKEAAMFSAVQETRRQWETVTETTRRIAIAADVELRRRHPDMDIEPLRSHPAEADGITNPASSNSVLDTASGAQPALDNSGSPDSTIRHRPQQEHAGLSRRRDLGQQAVLGLTPQAAHNEIPAQVLRIRDNARIAQAKIDDLASLPLPGPGDDTSSRGIAWPSGAGRDRDAVLQPPHPDVVPSARVLAQLTLAQAGAEVEMG